MDNEKNSHQHIWTEGWSYENKIYRACVCGQLKDYNMKTDRHFYEEMARRHGL